MRIAVTQPNFLPWLGYFDLVDSVDCFVVLDDVQLVRRSVIVRNRVRSHLGEPRWITLAISKCPQKTSLAHAMVSGQRPWWQDELHALRLAYGAAPGWPALGGWLAQALPPRPAESVAAYNLRLLQDLCGRLGCAPGQWRLASALAPAGDWSDPQSRMLEICRVLGASVYCNFRKGVEIGLYSPASFAEHGICLRQQDYHHPTYDQGHGQAFMANLSVLDLLAWHDPADAMKIVRSGRHWREAA